MCRCIISNVCDDEWMIAKMNGLVFQDDDDVNPVETAGPVRSAAPLNALNDSLNDKVCLLLNVYKYI